jgi:hypothetical protein
VVHQFQSALFPVPLRVPADFEPEAAGDIELVSQRLLDRDSEATTIPPVKGVLVVADLSPQFSTILLVAPVAGQRWLLVAVAIMVFLLGGKEQPSRFAFLVRDLLVKPLWWSQVSHPLPPFSSCKLKRDRLFKT